MKYARLKLEYKDASDIDKYLTSYKAILISLDTISENYIRDHYGEDYYDDLTAMINKIHKFVKSF